MGKLSRGSKNTLIGLVREGPQRILTHVKTNLVRKNSNYSFWQPFVAYQIH